MLGIGDAPKSLSNTPVITFLPPPRTAPLDQFPGDVSREEVGAAQCLRKENHGVKTAHCTDGLVGPKLFTIQRVRPTSFRRLVQQQCPLNFGKQIPHQALEFFTGVPEPFTSHCNQCGILWLSRSVELRP